MRELKLLKEIIEKQLVQSIEKIAIIDLVDLLVEYAYSSFASDIHLEPTEDRLRMRFRTDGFLRDIFSGVGVSKTIEEEIISRIKVLSGLRTDEHLAPQDGRFKAKIEGGQHIDIRVSIMPTYYGENAILRILAQSRDYELEDLGFSPKDLRGLEKAINKPYGMVLANGPTGSGKTTTLYTLLKKLNRPEVSIITIEDPIEYSLEGTTQVQINEIAGLTFANGLRSILRQDPNVIMVGEIRDQETAGIAVNAALTGHLVLSTLHTNDAATTFPRLLDMGVPPFLVASTVNMAIGQRLIRQLCEKCKVKKALTAEEIKSVGEIIPEITKEQIRMFYVPKGCDLCDQNGYQGRLGIREVIEVNDEIRQLIMNRANATQIKEAAIKAGMVPMIEDGLLKVRKGLTSLEEVIRLIHE